MKRFLLVICAIILATTGYAQNNRLIKGIVKSDNGSPIVGATIVSNHDKTEVKSTEGGAFEIRVSPYATYLGVTKEGYFPAKAEIEGSHLFIQLKVDKNYKSQKEKAAEQARIDAKAKAEAERKAAEQARIKAKAKAEAERKAAEQARIEAERQKQLAERKRLAKIKAENTKKENSKQHKGYRGIVDVAYVNKQISPVLGFSYTAGYQFNNQIYIGAGTGVDFNFNAGPSYRYVDYHNERYLTPSMVSIPLFAYFKANFINRRISPFFAMAAGGSLSAPQTLYLDLYEVKYSNNSIFANPQLGVSVRTTTDTSLNLAVGLHCYTAPTCSQFTGYNATITSAFLSTVDFHLSFTF